MGFAGIKNHPQYVFPTVIGTREGNADRGNNLSSKRGIEDLNFYIGDEAIANSKTYSLNYPIRHGQVDNWDLMEKFYQASIFQYLKCEPEDHLFLLVCFIINLIRIFFLFI